MMRLDIPKDASVIVADVLLEHKGSKKKVRMALDTGATYLIVPWGIAASLGLQPEISKERVEIITASGTERVPLVNLPSVSVGDAAVKGVKAVVHDLPSKSYVDGLLGLSFLRNFDVRLNFRQGYIELS